MIDATGLGAGLASFLHTALRGQCEVIPFTFTAPSKSDLGWRLLAAIAAGRYREYFDDGADDTRWFWRQVAACAFTVEASSSTKNAISNSV